MTKVVQYITGRAGNCLREEIHLLDKQFKDWGWESEYIFETNPIGGKESPDVSLNKNDLLVLHFNYVPPSGKVLDHPAEKTVLFYHKAAREEDLTLYDPELLTDLKKARSRLADVVAKVAVCIGHCEEACNRLVSMGAGRVRMIPPLIDFEKLRRPPDIFSRLMLADGRSNVLFCGSVDPTSGIEDLIKSFWLFCSFEDSENNWRLLIAGDYDLAPGYFARISNTFNDYELSRENYCFTGGLNDEQLRSHYHSADIYLSFDSGDLSGAAILKAIHFGVPVISIDAGAATDILGDAGILMREPIHSIAAENLSKICNMPDWRLKVMEDQKSRLENYNLHSVSFLLKSVFSRLIG